MAEMMSENELKEWKKLTESMVGSFEDIFSNTKGISENLRSDVKSMKSMVASAKSLEERENAILNAERLKNKVLNAGYSIQEKYSKTLNKNVDLVKDLVDMISDADDAFDRVSDASTKLGKFVDNALGSLKSLISEIPLIGQYLSDMVNTDAIVSAVSSFGTAINNSFKGAYDAALAAKLSFLSAVKSGLASVYSKIGSAFKVLLNNPIALAVSAITALVAVATTGYVKLSESAAEFRQNTGLLTSQTNILDKTIRNVVVNTGNLGIGFQEAYGVATQFSNEFENLENISAATAMSVLALEKNFGVSADAAIKVNKVFQNISDLTQEQAQFLIQNTALLAEQANVSPNKVLQDIAENSEVAYTFFSGSPEKLREAAIEAAKLGSSLGKASEVASKLLDFESSISSELNASAMLSVRLNFGRARFLAANNNIVGAYKEILSQVEQIGNLDSLNYYQKQALVDATGMQISEIMRLQDIESRFGGLDEKRIAAYNSLLSLGKDAADITEDDLAKQTEYIKNQNKFRSDFEVLKGELSGIGTELLAALIPIGKVLVSILNATVLPALRGVNSIVGTISSAVDYISGKFQKMGSYVNNDLGIPLATIVGYMTDFGKLLSNSFDTLLVYASVYKGLVYLKGIDLKKTIQRLVLERASKAITQAQFVVGTALGNINKKNLLMSAADGMRSVAKFALESAIAAAKTPIIGPILGAAALASAYALGKNYFSKAGDLVSPADGITRVSTKEGGLFELSPNDDIIAAPNLVGGASNASNGVNSLINEIKMLRKDLADGKIGVYMDGKKVTSRISNIVDGYGSNSYSIV